MRNRTTHQGRPLRILMTSDAIGGVFTYSLTLARELRRRGIEVHLALMGTRMTPGQRAATKSIDGLVVHESTFALEWMLPDPWSDVERAGEWLCQLERSIHPDIIHLNGYCHAAAHVGLRAPVVVVAHSCVLSWWEAVLSEAPPTDDDDAAIERYRHEVERGIRNADAVIAPTHVMMASLERHYGPIAAARRAIVPNGAHIKRRHDDDQPQPARKERAVLAAGRLWDRAKNIEALARVARLFPGPVRVAGATATSQGQEQHSQQRLAHYPNVHMLGFLNADELSREMDAAAIFAHPARYEPFGLCVLEAALHGCALVLGDIPSLREVWGDHAALFVDPDDEDALAWALERLAFDDVVRRALAARAKDRALTYTTRRMADRTIAVYLSVLRSESGSLRRATTTTTTAPPGERTSCA